MRVCPGHGGAEMLRAPRGRLALEQGRLHKQHQAQPSAESRAHMLKECACNTGRTHRSTLGVLPQLRCNSISHCQWPSPQRGVARTQPFRRHLPMSESSPVLENRLQDFISGFSLGRTKEYDSKVACRQLSVCMDCVWVMCCSASQFWPSS